MTSQCRLLSIASAQQLPPPSPITIFDTTLDNQPALNLSDKTNRLHPQSENTLNLSNEIVHRVTSLEFPAPKNCHATPKKSGCHREHSG